VTNNVKTINTNSYTSIIYKQVVSQNPGLQGSQVISTAQTDLGTYIQETAVFQSSTSIKQVTSNINKQTKQVTIIETV